MTKNEELEIIEKFKELYKEFPEGEIVVQEAPDFIVKSKNIKIGIEITETFQDDELKRDSADWAEFTDELIDRVQKAVPFTFSIGIRFSSKDHLKANKKEHEPLYSSLVPLCVATLKEMTNKQICHFKQREYLTKEIEEISFFRYEGLSASYNSKIEGGVVSNFTNKHLDKILNVKHEKLKEYTTCDKHWLVIKEGNYYAGTFNEIDLKDKLQSKFDKVFLLRMKKSKLYQLV